MSKKGFKPIFTLDQLAKRGITIINDNGLLKDEKKKEEIVYTPRASTSEENKIFIKPLSVNECWQGKRYKTDKYSNYEDAMLNCLKPINIPEPPLRLYYEFGFSSKLADLDNCVKPLQDILQKRYSFNDKEIFEMTVVKKIVPKGSEYLQFKIEKI